ncbi:RNA polymerase III subunit C17 [Komagataella phaffii CBS 7435]|uniref:DNA-directed RNA polymerase III subunit RPC9 n=2 Tax=Komagataella phaffii TaxID=460519 RepID=C4R6C7_KOMPG|nr:RNA polymerase III subunit C17 [Komagataella phaffii GS115]AOA63477.1 GQ67_04181T0 [Komagataella phaffii]CAH2449047.1 RNA polymerase III subunit C17 [Komagataella phaffii CBS 7435]AOA68656.1 GQ68_04154T0 [Komagataella phaffii GS115]CAY71113.1 RNA polymerase III subunit C17 [Komagataella phaffii GS115]CCA39089.1 RNA polymerase III subunit C17 [Komagataella phaffii CBS 7435]
MKIEIAREKFLSNFEVQQALVEIQKQNRWGLSSKTRVDKFDKNIRNSHLANLERITMDLSSYLDKSFAQDARVDSFVELINFLNGFELVKVEKLQMVNLLPRSLVSVYSIIEECDSRFTEDECESMLNKIEELFPVKQEIVPDQDGDLSISRT